MTVPDGALRLAGFALAHAAWSIEDGETLCTLSFHEVAGERQLNRYEAPTIQDSLEGAFEVLAEALATDGWAALVFDGYVTPDSGERTDALIAAVLGPGAERAGTIVQPYRPVRRSRVPLRRGSPVELLGRPQAGDELGTEADRLVAQGVREHPHGQRLWGGAIP